jgi:hypothetical protein
MKMLDGGLHLVMNNADKSFNLTVRVFYIGINQLYWRSGNI